MNFLAAAAGSIGLLPLPKVTMKSSFFSASSCRSSSSRGGRHKSFLSTGILPIPRMAMKSSCRSSSSRGGRPKSFLSTGILPIPRMAMKSICRSSSSTSHGGHNLFLVRRFTPEEEFPYFSLMSTENSESLCDFHSPLFYVDYERINYANGLMLLSITPPHYYLTKEKEHIFKEEEHLWNPSTNELKLLPPSHCRNHSKDCSTLFSTISFGFDPKSQDYKILRFVTNSFGDHHQRHLELYSLKYNSWKEILDYPTFFTRILEIDILPSYANGCAYWHTMMMMTEEEKKDPHPQFLSFDFATETFSFISLPETEKQFSEIVEFDGSLATILFNGLGLDDGELWVWNVDDGSWSMKFEIHVQGVDVWRLLWFSSDNQYLFLQGPSISARYRPPIGCFQVVVYDLRTKEFEVFAIDNYSSCVDEMDVYPYTHCKVALNGNTTSVPYEVTHFPFWTAPLEGAQSISGHNKGCLMDVL